jgi:hypothetical protein
MPIWGKIPPAFANNNKKNSSLQRLNTQITYLKSFPWIGNNSVHLTAEISIPSQLIFNSPRFTASRICFNYFTELFPIVLLKNAKTLLDFYGTEKKCEGFNFEDDNVPCTTSY